MHAAARPSHNTMQSRRRVWLILAERGSEALTGRACVVAVVFAVVGFAVVVVSSGRIRNTDM